MKENENVFRMANFLLSESRIAADFTDNTD